MSNLEIENDENRNAVSTIRLHCCSDAERDEPEEPTVSYSMQDVISRTDHLEELLLSLHEPVSAVKTSRYQSAEANQRKYSRCPIPEEQTSAVLTLNGRSFDCQLVELSIGGFGVVVPGKPRLARGAEGRLRAPGLNYIVGMTRQEDRAGGTFVGLRQIEEILDNDLYYSNTHPPLIGYLIAAVAGAIIATLMYYFKIGG